MSYTVAHGDTLSGIAKKLGVSLAALEQANSGIKNFNRISVGQVIQTPGGGGAPAAPAALNLDDAIKQYGVVGQIVSAIPELKDSLTWAIQNQASQDALNAKIAQTPWYQTHSDTLRNLILQQASDPATYQNNLNNAFALVMQTAGQMGRTGLDAMALAHQSLAEGWSTATLQTKIAQGGWALGEGYGAYAGDAGQLQAHLKQTASDYGVPFTDAFIDGYINKIQAGQDTTDGFDQLMRARAKAAYPHLGAQIDGGMTLRQIADPYMAQMSKTLELPQTAVTLNDPYVQKALAQVDPKTGAQTTQPLWQFDQQLKKDPRYDYTTQAKTDAYSTLAEVGKSWGFHT